MANVTHHHEAEDCDGETHFCWECDGEGFVEGDCFEDSCCCADPAEEHGVEPCRTCDGRGWWRCPLLPASRAAEQT